MPRKKRRSAKTLFGKSLYDYQGDLWGILFFLAAAFVFINYHYPTSTGFLGYWVVELALYPLIGDTVVYLPAFLAVCGVFLMFAYSRRHSILLSCAVSFLGFTVLSEILAYPDFHRLQWPLPTNGGGWIGITISYLLQKSVGAYGTWLILGGIFAGSFLMLCNVSFSTAVRSCLDFVFSKKKGKRKKKASALWPIMKRLLFYTTIRTQVKVKQKKVVQAPSPPSASTEHLLDSLDHVEDMSPPDSPPETAEKDSDSATIFEDLETPIAIPTKISIPPEAASLSPAITSSGSSDYELPPIDLLDKASSTKSPNDQAKLHQERALILEETLDSFNVSAKVVNVTSGPSITRYELQPGAGVKVSKITSLSKDIALKLAAQDVRIEAPIPGKALVGIEVPNPVTDMITLRHLVETTSFYQAVSKLMGALGVTISGESVIMDLGKMPHVLIAGATGSGKSVCLNAIILSILMRATPEDVKFLMIDPKKVELNLYNGIPHLIAPVVTDPHKAAATLKQWALHEMERRYEEFSNLGVKHLEGYNKKATELQEEMLEKRKAAEAAAKETGDTINEEDFQAPSKMPYIVVVIDELADLMMVASQEVETTICRLAQMARATGIHLIIATQRPSVNVITGLIKANVPSRVSFFLQSQIDSRTILDMPGAEKLLGKGDMLYSPVGAFKPKRLQGCFVSEKEVKRVVKFWKDQGGPQYIEEIDEIEPLPEAGAAGNGSDQDDLFEEAKNLIMASKYASTSYLQRKLRIGYNRAARLMDQLEEAGVISEYAGEKKPRQVL